MIQLSNMAFAGASVDDIWAVGTRNYALLQDDLHPVARLMALSYSQFAHNLLEIDPDSPEFSGKPIGILKMHRMVSED